MCPLSKQTLFSSIPVPSPVYPNEDTAQEETEGQQTSNRGDSIVESPIVRTDSTFSQISAHITVPLKSLNIFNKKDNTLTLL